MLDRIIALLLVIGATVTPVGNFSEILESRVVQFVMAVIVVLITIIHDVYTGLLLGLALIILYFRMHSRLIANWGDIPNLDSRKGGPMAGLVQEYITPEHLQSAQSNVFEMNDYDVEMKGIKGVYGEPVYGAQGIDATMPGYTKETKLMGDVFTKH